MALPSVRVNDAMAPRRPPGCRPGAGARSGAAAAGRLYEIGRMISRSLSHAIVTGPLIGVRRPAAGPDRRGMRQTWLHDDGF
jgi:hypothetical protein